MNSNLSTILQLVPSDFISTLKNLNEKNINISKIQDELHNKTIEKLINNFLNSIKDKIGNMNLDHFREQLASFLEHISLNILRRKDDLEQQFCITALESMTMNVLYNSAIEKQIKIDYKENMDVNTKINSLVFLDISDFGIEPLQPYIKLFEFNLQILKNICKYKDAQSKLQCLVRQMKSNIILLDRIDAEVVNHKDNKMISFQNKMNLYLLSKHWVQDLQLHLKFIKAYRSRTLQSDNEDGIVDLLLSQIDLLIRASHNEFPRQSKEFFDKQLEEQNYSRSITDEVDRVSFSAMMLEESISETQIKDILNRVQDKAVQSDSNVQVKKELLLIELQKIQELVESEEETIGKMEKKQDRFQEILKGQQ